MTCQLYSKTHPIVSSGSLLSMIQRLIRSYSSIPRFQTASRLTANCAQQGVAMILGACLPNHFGQISRNMPSEVSFPSRPSCVARKGCTSSGQPGSQCAAQTDKALLSYICEVERGYQACDCVGVVVCVPRILGWVYEDHHAG